MWRGGEGKERMLGLYSLYSVERQRRRLNGGKKCIGLNYKITKICFIFHAETWTHNDFIHCKNEYERQLKVKWLAIVFEALTVN